MYRRPIVIDYRRYSGLHEHGFHNLGTFIAKHTTPLRPSVRAKAIGGFTSGVRSDLKVVRSKAESQIP
ncbi:hypothetical protein J6590_009915 [Homalodisca vitripennis]|nr:hypothetical protein J6590_009915 [Homalodisca vitripennis]